MYHKTLRSPPERMLLSSGPASEPVTATEAKKQLEITGSAHDDQVSLLIEAAREQWEHDTDSALINQTWTLTTDHLREFRFPKRPVDSITGVTYYDSGNSQQTLSSSLYQLDKAQNAFRLAADQTWPATYGRWDAVTFIVVLGGHANESTVPKIAKQAMLLLIGHYFENRDDMQNAMREVSAYEALVRRYMRSSYP